MNRRKPILQILASRLGVYEVGVRTPADEYEEAERLSAAIRPAIEIIDSAIRVVYGGPTAHRETQGRTEAGR